MVARLKFPSALGILALALSAASSQAADQMQENFANCKLPSGSMLLPLPDSSAAANGYLLRFSDMQYTFLPKVDPNKKVTAVELSEQLRKAKTADLMFTTDGALWAVSGCIQDLGAKYLYEAVTEKLELPGEIPAVKNLPPGTLAEINEGRTYLIECANGCYVLLRALKKTELGLQAQFVYQPDGSLNFAIPQSELEELLPVKTLVPAALGAARVQPATPAVPTVGIANQPVNTKSIAGLTLNMNSGTASPTSTLEPFMGSFLRQRNQMIEHRVTIAKSEARTPIEQQKKTEAIEELAALRAEEAIPVLLTQITFMNTRTKAKEFSVEAFHPAVASLKRLGKPASLAALKALQELPLDAKPTEEATQGWQYRASLLATVVRGIEGEDVAEFLFKRDLAKADATRVPVYDTILNPRK